MDQLYIYMYKGHFLFSSLFGITPYFRSNGQIAFPNKIYTTCVLLASTILVVCSQCYYTIFQLPHFKWDIMTSFIGDTIVSSGVCATVIATHFSSKDVWQQLFNEIDSFQVNKKKWLNEHVVTKFREETVSCIMIFLQIFSISYSTSYDFVHEGTHLLYGFYRRYFTSFYSIIALNSYGLLLLTVGDLYDYVFRYLQNDYNKKSINAVACIRETKKQCARIQNILWMADKIFGRHVVSLLAFSFIYFLNVTIKFPFREMPFFAKWTSLINCFCLVTSQCLLVAYTEIIIKNMKKIEYLCLDYQNNLAIFSERRQELQDLMDYMEEQRVNFKVGNNYCINKNFILSYYSTLISYLVVIVQLRRTEKMY